MKDHVRDSELRNDTSSGARWRKYLLVESVRMHLLPVLIARGFELAPQAHSRLIDLKSADIFPLGLMRRARADGGTDLVEIQFKTYHRPAFRLNACVVPKEGMMTAGGYRTLNELDAGGLHDHFETHARPWLRPILKAVGLEPLGEWFSVRVWPPQSPKRAYDKLARRVANILPEIEVALAGGLLGPHVRKLEFKPLTSEVLERIKSLNLEKDDS